LSNLNLTSKKRIILCGRAASGKDYLRKKLQQEGYTYEISYTTRPPRTGEVDGVDYHFITEGKFKEMIANDEWYEYVVFNNWYYGTSRVQFQNTNSIFIMTPKGLGHVKPEDRTDCLVIYLDIPEDIRRQRISLRNDADSVERRIQADKIDFDDFIDYDVHITNPEFNISDIKTTFTLDI